MRNRNEAIAKINTMLEKAERTQPANDVPNFIVFKSEKLYIGSFETPPADVVVTDIYESVLRDDDWQATVTLKDKEGKEYKGVLSVGKKRGWNLGLDNLLYAKKEVTIRGFCIYSSDLLKDIVDDTDDDFGWDPDDWDDYIEVVLADEPPTVSGDRQLFELPLEIAYKLKEVYHVGGSSIMELVAAQQFLKCCQVFAGTTE